MSKSLKIIQVVYKVARIVSIVMFIVAIVAGALSLFGLTLLLILGRAYSTEFMHSLVEIGSGDAFVAACAACITGAISCAGTAVLFKFIRKYCEHELADGTPFTYDGSKELFRLGIISMIITAAVSILVGFVWSVCWVFAPEIGAPNDVSLDITSGLFMLLASCIFKYGAELREQKLAAEVELECLKSKAEKQSEAEETPTAEVTEE